MLLPVVRVLLVQAVHLGLQEVPGLHLLEVLRVHQVHLGLQEGTEVRQLELFLP